MEAISVTVTDQDIASVRYVNPVWEASDFFASDAAFELTGFAENCDTVTFEVANVEVVACDENECDKLAISTFIYQ
jgi:hypothetical protein